MSVLRFEPFRDPFERLFSMAATGTRAPLGMLMDVYRGEDGSYHVEADLPGADPDSIEVTVEHSTLTIQAERAPHYGQSEQVIAAERPQGSFARQLSGRRLGADRWCYLHALAAALIDHCGWMTSIGRDGFLRSRSRHRCSRAPTRAFRLSREDRGSPAQRGVHGMVQVGP
jgi:hypothetical protein